MSASFYDLLKYAKTGIASPDMTGFDKLRAMALGGKEKTLTGIPPLSFKANGKPLISWSMIGNGQQTGTPTPSAPIMPTFCGVRTGNLVDVSNKTGTQTNHYYVGWVLSGAESQTFISALNNNSTSTFSAGCEISNPAFKLEVVIYYTDSTIQSLRGSRTVGFTLYTDKIVNRVDIRLRSDSTDYDGKTVTLSNFMLNFGDTILPYEPYGYKIPITCAGQTVPVYLGQVSTVRKIKKLVLTGDENIVTDYATVSRAQIEIELGQSGASTPLISTHYGYNYGFINNTAYVGNSRPDLLFINDNAHATTSANFKAYLASEYAAGTPVTVWYVLATPETGIVNEPLCKIGDYADELSSEDAGVTIPTARGQNTLTVETDLQPSEMTITYK